MLPLATHYHTHYHFHPFHFKFKDLVAKQHPTSYNVQLPIVQAVKMIWRVSNKPLTIKCPPSSQAHQATGILDWRLERLYTSLFSSRILAIPKSLSLIWRSKVNHEGHMKPQVHMCIYIYTYRISSIRRRGYNLFHCSFCEATIWGWRLFLWKAWRHQWRLDKVGTSEMVTVARHCQ